QGGSKGVTHAGEVETALVMALLHDQVQGAQHIRKRAGVLAPVSGASYLASGSENPIKTHGAWWTTIYQGDQPGYSGDPAAASPETGHQMIAAITERLAQFYVSFMRADLRSGVK